MSAPLLSPPRPRPIEVGPTDDGRLVPPGWLDDAPVTRAVIALNVAVFLVQLVTTGGRSLMNLPPSEAHAFGACDSLFAVGENRWETLVTACFLHDGIFHIGFNMLALWQAGPLVERAVGSARMAPMYLAAGVAGNAVCVEYAMWSRSAQITLGASGAICGLLAAAFVVGLRVQGWSGPLTQAMARWLGLVLAFGLVANRTGAHVANGAHMGGALAGAAIAATWRRGYRHSRRSTAVMLALCSAVVMASIAVVVVRDRTDPFAVMGLQERNEFTNEAIADGRCRDAYDGLLAVERLRARLAPVTPLRNRVQAVCGPQPPP